MRIAIPYTRYSFFPPQEIPPELAEIIRSTSEKEFRILLSDLFNEEKRQFIQKSPIIHWLSVISVTVLALSALTGMAALACWMLGLDRFVRAIFANEVAILIPAASFFCSFLLFRGYLETYSSFQKYLRAKKRYYLGLKKDMEPAIVHCVECGTKNRILPNFIGLRPVCRGCGAILAAGAPRTPTPRQARSFNPALCILLLVSLGGTVYGIFVTPSLLKKDFTAIAKEEASKTEEVRKEYEQRLSSRRVMLEKELSVIDSEALRRSALAVYKSELTTRKSYDNRFALSPRERAYLHMQAIASDSTKSLHDALRAVAQAASPEGADVNVRESSAGIALHIDFDMFSMTSGEHGTHTKHHTKESLRKEVISLISRVTNDIFQFCKDLHLASIEIGCRHVVRTTYQSGPPRDENTVLYKIRIRKNRLQELTNNPFLDVYSTTRHFEVAEDNFKNIEIITSKI
jgi:hypothetical protein